MGCAGMIMARVVGRIRWIGAGKRIYPGARSQAVLTPIQTRSIWIGTSHTEMRSSPATGRVATKAASVVFQGKEGVLQPGLADLFEAIIVVRSTAHPIEILRDNGVVHGRQLKPIERLIAIIAGGCSYRQANLSSVAAKLIQGRKITDNDIGSRYGRWRIWTFPVPSWEYSGMDCAVHQRRYFDWVKGQDD